MKKVILNILLCLCAVLLYGCACKKDEVKIEYNDEEAVAEGTVDLTGDEPEIFITSIKAKKGAEIDYLSGVVIENEDDFDDLKIWVDESAVDIYVPGDYKAKYTFEYDGKSAVYEITVTILDEEVSTSESIVPSSSDVVADNETKPSGNSSTSKNEGTTKPQDTISNPQDTTSKPQDTISNPQDTTSKPQATTSKPQATTSKPQAATKPTNGNSSTSETTRREIITSSQNSTTKETNIGYSYIELLSGSTISIKTTTSRYIVSTRTDVSYNTKNGVKYKVSKLIITYNTGEERTLETVEEKCK